MRIDLDGVLGLIGDGKYFVLHTPRRTGKTSALLALRDLLNGGGAGDCRCVYANVEAGQAMRENVAEGIRTVLSQTASRASETLGDDTLERPGSSPSHESGRDRRCIKHWRSGAWRRARVTTGHPFLAHAPGGVDALTVEPVSLPLRAAGLSPR